VVANAKRPFILSNAAYITSAEAVKHDNQSDHPIDNIEHLGLHYLDSPKDNAPVSDTAIGIFAELIGKVLRR
jgi:hypothetical protein